MATNYSSYGGRQPGPSSATYQNQDQNQGNYNRDDLQSLVSQTITVQEESARSAQRSAQLALQAEDTANESLRKLGLQGEQIDRIKDRLNVANESAKLADKQSTHLVNLNRSMFIPVVAPPPAQPSALDSVWSFFGYSSTATTTSTQESLAPPSIKPRTTSLPSDSPALRDPNYKNPQVNTPLTPAKTYESRVGEWATEEERAISSSHEMDETKRQTEVLRDTSDVADQVSGNMSSAQRKVDKVRKKN
ncbi:hypothetical protein HDU76_000173 [Blyttiomyces sp. JEL0837]|nr:hypothetical protein HDU76_000173 [Blyttiomyces sp. JEL0837]